MRATHSRSCARVNRAGIATMVRPPSRHALTVRARRRDLRTSTTGAVSSLGASARSAASPARAGPRGVASREVGTSPTLARRAVGGEDDTPPVPRTRDDAARDRACVRAVRTTV